MRYLTKTIPEKELFVFFLFFLLFWLHYLWIFTLIPTGTGTKWANKRLICQQILPCFVNERIIINDYSGGGDGGGIFFFLSMITTGIQLATASIWYH